MMACEWTLAPKLTCWYPYRSRRLKCLDCSLLGSGHQRTQKRPERTSELSPHHCHQGREDAPAKVAKNYPLKKKLVVKIEDGLRHTSTH